MGVDILLCIICGGFMCICSGFGTYGCYRCFTDKAGESRSRVHSEYTIRNAPTKKQKTKGSASSSSTILSSFNGTIYSINSQDSFANFNSSKNDGSGAVCNQQQKWGLQNLRDNHDYAVSINPKLVHYDIQQSSATENTRQVRQVHTAP